MAFTQETFFNASVRNFSGSVGWGMQPSRLTVNLVEDPDNNDNFTSVPVGTPVYFNYQNWQFGGLVQNYSENSGRGGNPVFGVELEDPRELLSGVQLILQDYSGFTYGVPNLYNIYGYLENLYGFGGAQSNETGIPWKLLRDALYNLQLSTPISFRGYYYVCFPFYGMNNLLPDYYRVSGNVITLMDFISDICNTISCDYHINMIPYYNVLSPATNQITLNLVDRSKALRTGAIDEFVGQVDGAVAKKRGYELRNETTSKFVVGGKLNSLYFQPQGNHTNNYDVIVDEDGDKSKQYKTDKKYYADDVILPYWGYDCFDKLVIGRGDFDGETGTEYRFEIDGRPIYAQTGISRLINYKTDLAEMKAARQGQEAWEALLSLTNYIPSSPHYGKSSTLRIGGRISAKFGMKLVGATLSSFPDREISKLATDRTQLKGIEETRRQNNIAAVYKYIRHIADEYYGKKFMVRIPFVETKKGVKSSVDKDNDKDNEEHIIKYSLEPSEAGYVDESNYTYAAAYGYMPYNPYKFTNSDNKISAYARFSNNKTIREIVGDLPRFYNIDSYFKLDDLPIDSYILDQYPDLKRGKMRENMFVKGTLDEDLVFLDKDTLYSPRVVITLDAPVKDNTENFDKSRMLMHEIIRFYLSSHVNKAELDRWVRKNKNAFGADHMWKNKEANPQIPDLTALPLTSNILRYGPWYISNKPGKVEFEVEDSLTPWNYGGYTVLNNAGWAKVSDALSGQQVGETGSIEFPGVPIIPLGGVLLSSGPTVTDISVDISENGATTRYNMKTWSFEFGRMNKYNADRLKEISQLKQKQRQAFRKLYGYDRPIQISSTEHKEIYPEYKSSSLLVAGEIVANSDENTYKPNIAMGSYELIETIDKDTYINKAGMSLDGLYVPYSTEPSGTYDHHLPRFEIPTDNAESPTVSDLNPFGDAGIALAFPESSGLPDDLSNEYGYTGDVRAIGLKAPVIIGGWGFDTDGNPVPSGGISDEFFPDYKNRADKWKVGPLDVRWDNDRKVWNASGGGTTSIKLAKLETALTNKNTAKAIEWSYNSKSGEIIPQGTEHTVRDWLLPDHTYLPVKTRIFISQIDNIWYVLGAAPSC